MLSFREEAKDQCLNFTVSMQLAHSYPSVPPKVCVDKKQFPPSGKVLNDKGLMNTELLHPWSRYKSKLAQLYYIIVDHLMNLVQANPQLYSKLFVIVNKSPSIQTDYQQRYYQNYGNPIYPPYFNFMAQQPHPTLPMYANVPNINSQYLQQNNTQYLPLNQKIVQNQSNSQRYQLPNVMMNQNISVQASKQANSTVSPENIDNSIQSKAKQRQSDVSKPKDKINKLGDASLENSSSHHSAINDKETVLSELITESIKDEKEIKDRFQFLKEEINKLNVQLSDHQISARFYANKIFALNKNYCASCILPNILE